MPLRRGDFTYTGRELRGLTSAEQVHDLLDVCEVAPPFDHGELSSNAAATLIWTYLCGASPRDPRSAT
jgi:arginase family enzyme